ncbi:hypothetical protein GOV06_03070 [Candidatus Woesearchaeota archaeon]|nr:hypothetical protein [Candidatus Woesearchaeota archaeon]
MWNPLSLFRKPKPLELSVEELWEMALDKPSGQDGGRKVLLVVENQEFRFVPCAVSETAQTYLDETGDVEKVLRYVANAFYIYRDTACHGFLAPHYKVDGAYEWPKPVKFSWESIDAVIIGGEYVNGPIPEDGKARVMKEVGDKIEETEIKFNNLKNAEGEVFEQIITREESVRDIIPGKDQLQKELKYKIDNLKDVGFIGMQDWQTRSLRVYANPFYHMICDLLEGKVSRGEIRGYVEDYLACMTKSYKTIVGRYRKHRFEKINPDALMWNLF